VGRLKIDDCQQGNRDQSGRENQGHAIPADGVHDQFLIRMEPDDSVRGFGHMHGTRRTSGEFVRFLYHSPERRSNDGARITAGGAGDSLVNVRAARREGHSG
jgi:hypothetical protein